MFDSQATFVLPHGHVQAPVQAVFDPPMLANSLSHMFGVDAAVATDIVPSLRGHAAAEVA